MKMMANIHEDPQLQSNNERQFDAFFEAEKALNFEVPVGLKNILKAAGFEHASLLAQIKEPQIEEIEAFARNELHNIIPPEDLPKYYGPYCRTPSLFKFVPGHRIILSTISTYYQKKVARKTLKFANVDSKVTLSEKLSSVNDDNEDLAEDDTTDITEESQKIKNSLISWAKSKAEKDNWETIKAVLDNTAIKVHIYNNDAKCNIHCACGAQYNILKFAKGNSKYKRWIYSNFQTHLLKKHISIGRTCIPVKKQTNFITNYVSTPTSSKKNIRVLQDILIHQSSEDLKLSVVPDILEPPLSITSQEKQEDKRESFTKSSVKPTSKGNSVSLSSVDINCNVASLNSTCNEAYTEVPIEKDKPTKQSSEVVSNTNKWKHFKYQRSERTRRAREQTIDNVQTFITDYFDLIKDISTILTENSFATEQLLPKIQEEQSLDNVRASGTENNKLIFSEFLNKLMELSLQNSSLSPNKNTYDEVTKQFSVYLYYTGGRLLYETLQANLPKSLPSISTLNRYTAKNRQCTIEGEINFEGLLEFLNARKCNKVVWISEDATRITGKIEYDSRTNKVLGFTLPLKSGLPQINSFLATSAKAMRSYFKTGTKSTYANVIMAQPLSANTPAFCLSVFGTENVFKGTDVLDRWKYIKSKAAEFGITVAGFSSDGDPRLLKAMRLSTELPTSKENDTTDSGLWRWFQMSNNKTKECYIQDTTHIITKMRTRFLKNGILLPIGNYFATVDHLHSMVATMSKEKHLLTSWDLKGMDKMNFLAGKKMCSMSVIENLKHIPASEATTSYLKLMNFIIQSLLDDSSALEQRIYAMWYVVFFLRVWKAWLKTHNEYTVRDNFLTSNCYLCIELNAHSMLKLIMRFKGCELTPNMFVPSNFSSQPCEKLFRMARSMTSTYSTVINFSMKRFLQHIERINQVYFITNDINQNIKFPREDKKKATTQYFPTIEEFRNLNIEETVGRALNDVIKDTKLLGINIESSTWYNKIDMPSVISEIPQELSHDIAEIEIDGNHADDVTDVHFDITILGENKEDDEEEIPESLELKDFSGKISEERLTEDSPFVKVQLQNTEIVIRKATYCWLLDENNGKVSTDRLRRFFANTNKKPSQAKLKRKSKKRKISASSLSEEDSNIELSDYDEKINVLEKITVKKYYAVFYDDNYYIGRVLEVVESESVKMTFLKRELNLFVWPRHPDVANVNKQFIFYGPILLSGNGPFEVTAEDLININEKYKLMKSKF